MSWFTVEKIDGKTFAISEYGHKTNVHSYLFVGQNEAALIDSGLGVDNIGEVVKSLTSLPIIVLTTHAHWDHIGGHKYFEDIRIHTQDAGWLENGVPLPPGTVEKSFSDINFSKPIPKNFDLKKYKVFHGKPKHLLSRGQIIDLGNRKLEIIHAPGHSPGHICVFEKETGYLATGDLIYGGTLFCNFESTDPVKFYESMKKISKLKIKKILPGHNSLDLPVSIIDDAVILFENIKSKNLLKHGLGRFSRGKVEIIL
ncbi:MAG: MBL fold metallo-hydrolase [Candidatus Berkelbacteria bacterium]